MEEVKEAIDSFDSNKSPGPDGFNFGFLKEFWDIYKGDLMKMMIEFHTNGRFVRGFSPSFIVFKVIKSASRAQSLEYLRKD
ncbi:hypothetical protein OROHE_005117 [Orobanche hederae]